MTKQSELALLDELIGKLPCGYIKDILTDFRPGIEQAVMNDFGFVGWREAWDHLRELETEAKRLREESASLRSSLRSAEGQLAWSRDQLRDLRTSAQHVADRLATA